MRIISQDGKIDVPYEQISVERRDNEIWAGYSSALQRHQTGSMLAKYSTAEIAEKAMDILHNEYQYTEECKIMGTYVSKPANVFRFQQEDEVKRVAQLMEQQNS